MKTIKPMQVEYFDVSKLEPGMIVSEGVVLAVDVETGRYATVSAYVVGVGPIAVYARITPEMLDLLVEAVRGMTTDAG